VVAVRLDVRLLTLCLASIFGLKGPWVMMMRLDLFLCLFLWAGRFVRHSVLLLSRVSARYLPNKTWFEVEIFPTSLQLGKSK